MKAAESFSLFKLYTTTAGFSSGGAPPATGGVRHPKAPPWRRACRDDKPRPLSRD